VLVTEGRDQAAPLLRSAARVFAGDQITLAERLRSAVPAVMAASMVWDNEYWYAIEARHVQSCREAGSLAQLALSVNGLAIIMVWQGDFAAAASLVAEAEAIAAATGTRFARHGAMLLAGYRGAEAEAAPLIEAGIAGARAAGHGGGVQWSQWVSAILYNGLGRYQTALAQAQQASEQSPELHTRMWALPELIEAASRTGQTQLATDALARLAEATSVALTDWGQGIYARSRALLSDGEDAETWYRQAVDRLNRTALRTELAHTPALRGVAAPRGPPGRRARAAHRYEVRVVGMVAPDAVLDSCARRGDALAAQGAGRRLVAGRPAGDVAGARATGRPITTGADARRN
jgi:tetratricopeptide (TPR) repeat protein